MDLFWPWWASFDWLLLVILLIGGAGVLIFLLLREAFCWYWRINEGVSELQSIRELLQEINRKLDSSPACGHDEQDLQEGELTDYEDAEADDPLVRQMPEGTERR